MQYIFTWIALTVLLAGALLLLVFSWNSFFREPPSPVVMITVWILMSASAIFLFLLAAKKVHRLKTDEAQDLEEQGRGYSRESIKRKETLKDREEFDFASSARKLIRRTPENTSPEEAGRILLKNLARELEIMSGIFYCRKEEEFKAVATYAMKSSSEPYTFREGEGLTGQVARNKQIMVLTRLPEGYVKVFSGLGSSQPSYLAIVPLVQRNRTLAVLECSGYRYDPHEIENMFRIFSRDVMDKIVTGIDNQKT